METGRDTWNLQTCQWSLPNLTILGQLTDWRGGQLDECRIEDVKVMRVRTVGRETALVPSKKEDPWLNCAKSLGAPRAGWISGLKYRTEQITKVHP